MNAKRIWTTLALTGLAVLATASVGSSVQLRGPQGKQATDSRSTLGETGTPFCSSGDIGAKCGHFGPGKLGHGCENSLGLGGALLTGHGSARLCQDNLVLEASSIPVPTTVVFLESTEAGLKGGGYTFGDGVMCLTRSIHRVAVQQPRRVGMATYPMLGDSPLSVDGKVTMLQPTRYYQVMYRDSEIMGREKHFNLTNALMVVWSP
ncbi:MAG: hypothetical protein ACKVXR_12225 [Planctomycetota bacterium]